MHNTDLFLYSGAKMHDAHELDKLHESPLHTAIEIQDGVSTQVRPGVDHVITIVELSDCDVDGNSHRGECVHTKETVDMVAKITHLVVDLVDLGHPGGLYVNVH